ALHEDGRFRLWYQARSRIGGGNSHAIAYAESSDGRRWEKPDLGLVEFEGSRANNLTTATAHLASVLRGTAPGEPRYWLAGSHFSAATTPEFPLPGIYLWRSEDGYRWTRDS